MEELPRRQTLMHGKIDEASANSPVNCIDTSKDWQTLCRRCSLIPLAACRSRNLDYQSFNLVEWAKSQYRICRLIGRVMTNHQAGREFYRLDWHHSSSADSPVIGSLRLISMHMNHNEAERRIPVGFIIAPNLDALENFLHQLCPARVDFGRMRSWLCECNRARIHDSPSNSLCARDSQELLHQLRVIHCHTRRVVIAPSTCNFVALSYI
jgi:hypothetical protein